MKLMVAAISNHLHFDLYDLDVGGVGSNTELWKVLVRMKNRSILLVEDVNCALTTAPWRDMNGEGPDGSSPASKNHKVSLSGLLNMVDGDLVQQRPRAHPHLHHEPQRPAVRLDLALLRPPAGRTCTSSWATAD